ncbi:hypothetical protein BGY98DRAFT_941100 [Russula aff. rugulosa BPL654]|nr:hypothetical protein BGY98DRAFT_941100 [Russula aff. rugulosa BPL654]
MPAYETSDGNLVMTRTFIRVVLAPLPAIWSTTHVINWCGNGAHMMAYPISKAHTSRVYASPSQPPSNLATTRIAKWGFGASRLIETAEKIMKVCRKLRWRCNSSIDLDLEISVQFGLYDRLGLRSWHKGRIVLLKAVFLTL